VIYDLEHGKVDFLPSDIIDLVSDNISIALSGGADSAAVMCMLCEAIDRGEVRAEIFPYTFLDLPGTHMYSQAIVDVYRDMFPNVTIHTVKTFKTETDSIRNLTNREKHVLSKSIEVYKWKVVNNALFTLNGENQTPAELNSLGDRPAEGDISSTVVLKKAGIVSYSPLINVTKKFVADIYYKYQLMDSIFPLTRSCVGDAEETDYYSRPCKECWWCQEKYWAFGSYDHTED